MAFLRFGWFWICATAGLLVVMAIIWLVLQYAVGLQLLSVQTGSMRPTFAPHDALIMRRVQPADIRPGMIVSYHGTRNPAELVTHRVLSVSPDGAQFRTKGDALAVSDPSVATRLASGRVLAVVPGMGRLLDMARSWLGLVIFIYIPAGVIAVQELLRLERTYFGRRFYRYNKKTSGMMGV